ncbi:hypothetical protein ABG067_000778, partial [Albugo candida]
MATGWMFIEVMQAGHPFIDDMNGYQQEAFGWMEMTFTKDVDGALHTLITNIMTSTIEFQGRRTTGVHVKYNRTHCQTKFRANKEIILSGGAINTPQLLLLLGVGDADNLKQVDVPL